MWLSVSRWQVRRRDRASNLLLLPRTAAAYRFVPAAPQTRKVYPCQNQSRQQLRRRQAARLLLGAGAEPDLAGMLGIVWIGDLVIRGGAIEGVHRAF